MEDNSKFQILSGSWLKVIAMVSMFIDHAALVLMSGNPNHHIPYFSIGHYNITDYFICRGIIGRIAFPIFAFLLVEGYRYTKSRKKYAFSLLVFAMLSTIPWNLIHGSIVYHSSFNVLFTLFVGVIGMMMIDNITISYKDTSKIPLIKSIGFIIFLLAIRFLRLDYGVVGVAYIVLLHLLQGNVLGQFAATLATFSYSRFHHTNFLAFIPIMLYNGKRGFIRGKVGKYIMYTFYPLHLLFLWWIKGRLF